MPLFVRDGDVYIPTEHTTGPWRSDAQHGGPPAALLARVAEALVGETEAVARISVELVRPVPLEPLTTAGVRTTVSRRVTHVESRLLHEGATVATCRALVLTRGELPEPAWTPEDPPRGWSVPAPEARIDPPAWASGEVPITYHQHGVEHRMTRGTFGEPGPATSWVRLNVPLIDGEETSALCRLMAAADFGSGISSVYAPGQRAGLINADLTVALARQPRGEWTVVHAQTTTGGDGIGLCVSELGDEHGPVGIGTQSLLGLAL